MLSLVIDTTTKQQKLAIYCNEQRLGDVTQLTNNSHLEIIFSNLKRLEKLTNVTLNQLEQIIVINGPGSFTGVRIGIMVAKVLACEYKIDLYTISTLQLLATSYLNQNKLAISMSKIKNFVINYDIINGKLVNILESSQINTGEVLTNIELNYDNLFKHQYLWKKTNYLDAEPNYIETPNYVKKINK